MKKNILDTLDQEERILQEKAQQLEQKNEIIKKYKVVQKHLRQIQERKKFLETIVYSEKANAFFTKEELDKDIYAKQVQRISLSELIARMFIEQDESKRENQDIIFLNQLEYYSEIANQRLTEEIVYSDDPQIENKPDWIKEPIYRNPKNNICYIYKNTSKNYEQLKQEITTGSHEISKYIEIVNVPIQSKNTKIHQPGIRLKDPKQIEKIKKQYNLEKKSKRVKTALTSQNQLPNPLTQAKIYKK